MKPIAIVASLLCRTAVVLSVPSIQPSRADIIKRSELVAVVLGISALVAYANNRFVKDGDA